MMASLRMSPRTALRIWRLVMGGGCLYTGFGYAFGPSGWYQAPSLELVRQFFLPIPVWGALMLLAGVLIFTEWRRWGHLLAMMIWAFWFSCITTIAVASLAEWLFQVNWGMPTVSAWGSPVYVLTWLMLHIHMMVRPEPHHKVFVVPERYYESDGSDG